MCLAPAQVATIPRQSVPRLFAPLLSSALPLLDSASSDLSAVHNSEEYQQVVRACA